MSGLVLEGIGQIHVSVKDLDRAVGFYRDVLGLRLLFRFPGMAFFDCGGVRLFLAPPEKPDLAGTSILYFRVQGIEAAEQVLTERGVRIVSPARVVHQDGTQVLRMCFFQDSEDNHLALMSETARG